MEVWEEGHPTRYMATWPIRMNPEAAAVLLPVLPAMAAGWFARDVRAKLTGR